MVKRELGSEAPYGGLLADAMGLGKTLEVLAAMVGNPFSEEDAKNTVKGTLLVLPSSAIKQWETEIRLHAEDYTFRKVIHYTSRMGVPLWALTEADIVLTSYSEVRNSFPYPSRSELEACGGYRQWAESFKKSPGVLHQLEWYRIVLDEA
jgi:SNF2 family DNA or RNA helicase